jgi:hypothetical protein
MGSRTLGTILAVPSLLLVVAVVYCQMHYGMDSLAAVALAGLVMIGMVWGEKRVTGSRQTRDPVAP